MAASKVSTLFVINVISCLCYLIAPSQSELFECDGSTEYFERGSSIEILCANETSPLGTLWYRGESNEAFLRLDEGKKVEPEGYSITDNGAMVIENLQIDHEGLYRVTIIDRSSNTEQKRISIYAKVTSTEELRVEQCRSSSSEWCTSLDKNLRATTLLCYAEGTRPAANLTWNSSSPSSRPMEASYNTSVNDTSSLFTAYSTLKYDPADFTLQLFTCSISGVPVTSIQHRSEYVEGTQAVTNEKVMEKNVSEAGMQLECPSTSSVDLPDTLRRWIYVHPNGTVEVLRHTYPGSNSGPCYSKDKCDVSENGVLTIAEVTYKDEGRYDCVYSNSSYTGQVSTTVRRIIIPDPPKTVIKGCNDHEYCDLPVDYTGSVECSIRGSRPSITPGIVVMDSDAEHVFLFDYQYLTTEKRAHGTFDTTVIAEYKIEECSGDVQLHCIAGERINGVDIPSSVVNLITDTSKCEGRTGLVVFLVLFFLILIAGIIIIFIKREYVRRKLSKCLPLKQRSHPERAEEAWDPEERLPMNPKKGFTEEQFQAFQFIYDDIASEKATAVDFVKITEFCNEKEIETPIKFLAAFLLSLRVEDKAEPSENKKTDDSHETKIATFLNFVLENQPKEWVVLYQDMLNKLATNNKMAEIDYLDLLWRMYTSKKIDVQKLVGTMEKCLLQNIFTLELVEGKLKESIKEDTVDKSMDFITAFCQSEIYNGKEEKLLGILSCIFENANNPGVVQYLDLLHKLVLLKKVSATNYISLVGITYQKGKIKTSKYVEITGRCLDENIMTFDLVMNELKNFVDKRYCSRNEVTDSMLAYYLSSQVDEEALVNEVCAHLGSSSNKFLFPYFLQSLYQSLPKDSETQKIVRLFKLIRSKFLNRHGKYKNIVAKIGDGDTEKVDLEKSFVQFILISHELTMIDGDTCIEIIQSTAKIGKAEFENIIKQYVSNQVVSTEVITQLLALAVDKKMITDEFYVQMLVLLKDERQLPFERYIDLLKSALLEQLIFERCFEKQVVTHIERQEWDKRAWISLVAELAKNKSIGDSLRVNLFELIFKHFKVSKDDVDKVLITKLGMTKEEKEVILHDVKLPKWPKSLQFPKGKPDDGTKEQ